ncbi:MAG: PAS domain-containing protein [Rhizobiales bacterium]|nr:PAS domain-containing protein [Hyphomicrobiales bacterium]
MGYRAITLDEMPAGHPVAVFQAYWESCLDGQSMPSRERLSPSGVPSVAPWILVLEPIDMPDSKMEYRYRLAGTGCREIFCFDYTNKLLGEHLTEEGAQIRRQEFADVIQDQSCIYSWTELPINGRNFIKVYRGVFPVSTKDGAGHQIFVVIAPDDLRLNPNQKRMVGVQSPLSGRSINA